MQEISVERF